MYPDLPSETFASRRRALLERMPDRSAALFVATPPAERNSDVVYPYRPDSDLWYLTGCDEPSTALLLTRGCGGPESVIFVRDRDPKQEQWTGFRVGVAEAAARFGVDAAFPIEKLADELTGALKKARTLIYRPARASELTTAVHAAMQAVRGGPRGPHKGPDTVLDPTLTLHELRMIKSAEEIERIRAANSITHEGLRSVIASSRPGTGEWEIQAGLEAAFRGRGGWGWAYPTIVASGHRACVLHYDSNAARAEAGDLVLIDAGAEVGGYGADVSRTFPVSPRFEPAQRDLYQLVLDAQEAVIDRTAPDQTLDDLHLVAIRVLAEGMVTLGLLEGPLDRVLETEAFKRYYPHQTSHWLGLDVHDVGRYYLDDEPRVLRPGMVFTVEPGLYVPRTDEDAPEAFRGLGVRIEDDVLVTARGCENLSAGIPKGVDEIEGLKG
jgi:Xaa-Pro aminopeptidase